MRLPSNFIVEIFTFPCKLPPLPPPPKKKHVLDVNIQWPALILQPVQTGFQLFTYTAYWLSNQFINASDFASKRY